MGQVGVIESSSRRELGFPSGPCRRAHPLKQCSVQEFPEPQAVPPHCLCYLLAPENPDLPPLKPLIVMLHDLRVQRAPSQPLLMPRSSATVGTPHCRAPAPDRQFDAPATNGGSYTRRRYSALAAFVTSLQFLRLYIPTEKSCVSQTKTTIQTNRNQRAGMLNAPQLLSQAPGRQCHRCRRLRAVAPRT